MKQVLRAVLASLAILTMSPAIAAEAQTAPARPVVAPLPPGVTRGPTVEGITEYRLANGLRFVLFPDPSKPTTTVNITYLVGSRQENYGETGMAHLLEHLIFKGSKNFPQPRRRVQQARLPEQRHRPGSIAPTTSPRSRPATTT